MIYDELYMSNLCNIQDIPEGESKGFNIDGKSVFAVKRDDQVFVYVNSCPHLGIELEWNPDQFLDSEGYYIQCSTHGALFTVETGECVAGPCQGQQLTPAPFAIVDGQILLTEAAEAID